MMDALDGFCAGQSYAVYGLVGCCSEAGAGPASVPVGVTTLIRPSIIAFTPDVKQKRMSHHELRRIALSNEAIVKLNNVKDNATILVSLNLARSAILVHMNAWRCPTS
jgi:hypothetical protein